MSRAPDVYVATARVVRYGKPFVWRYGDRGVWVVSGGEDKTSMVHLLGDTVQEAWARWERILYYRTLVKV